MAWLQLSVLFFEISRVKELSFRMKCATIDFGLFFFLDFKISKYNQCSLKEKTVKVLGSRERTVRLTGALTKSVRSPCEMKTLP